MPNVMVALPNIGGALCSTPQSLADAQYYTQHVLANISRSRYVAIASQPVHRMQIRPIVHN